MDVLASQTEITSSLEPISKKKYLKFLLFSIPFVIGIAGIMIFTVFPNSIFAPKTEPVNKDSLLKPIEFKVTGVLRTSGLYNESDRQSLGPGDPQYQVTDFGLDSAKTTDESAQGYFLISDNLNESLVGKCIAATGNVINPTGNIIPLSDTLFRRTLSVTSLEEIGTDNCHPYLYANQNTTAKVITLDGKISHASRPSPDINYDYEISLSSPYLDKESPSGSPQYVDTIVGIPTSDSVWINVENNLERDVRIEGRMVWGYAESKYFEIINITPINAKLSQLINWQKYSGKTFSYKYPNSWADPIETVLSTRTEISNEGNFVISDGYYYNQLLGRNQTYQEYTNQVVPKTIKSTPVVVSDYAGVRYLEEDNSGRTMVNIIFSKSKTSDRILSIIYISPVSDEKTINELLMPILESIVINTDTVNVPAKNTAVVKLYYHDNDIDPNSDQCYANNYIEKSIPKTISPIKDTINTLIRSDVFEQNNSFVLQSVNLKDDGSLVLKFPMIGGFTTGGSCRVGILTSQITKTAMQYPSVKRVLFEPDVFQP